MARLTQRQLLSMTIAILAIAALRLVFGPFNLQGVLFIVVTAVASWQIGPRAGGVAMGLGAVVAHFPRLLQSLGGGESALRFDRPYFTALGMYFLLSGIAIAVGKRHLRTVHELEASRRATERAERAHRQQLEAALIRETAARRDAEQANQLREELLKRVSLDLRRARELAAIVESSEDAIIGTDLGSLITSWNRAAQNLFGFSAAETIGRPIYRLIPAALHDEERDVLERLKRGENVVHFETVRQRRDGTTFPISLTVSPIRDEHGAVVGASKIARDISERRRAEAAVADLQTRLVSLVSASGSLLRSPQVEDVVPAILRVAHDLMTADGYAVWRHDPQTNAWVALSCSGVSPGFVSGTVPAGDGVAMRDPMAVEDAAAFPLFARRQEAFAREGIVSVMAVPLVARDRVTGMVSFYYRHRHVFEESEIQAASAFGNLAATALTTAELYDAQQRSRQASDFLADTSILLSQTFDQTKTLNEIVRRAVPYMADWCAVDLVGDDGNLDRMAVAHVDPEQVERVRDVGLDHAAAGTSAFSPLRAVRTREPILLEWSHDESVDARTPEREGQHGGRAPGVRSFMIVPLIARERAMGAISFVMGPSGRRYAAADLRLAEALASRIALAVDNARAYEEATQANRLKDEFLATLSHELRTPLNAIVGYVQMLSGGVLDGDRLKRALVVLDRNTTALTRLVEDVLDVSRFAAGKVRLDLKPVDITAVVEQAIASTRPAADAKGVRLEAITDQPLGRIFGDADRLQQVIWNLLSNAVKFTDRGGRVHVSIGATPTHADIVVADTGCGIRREFLPHVFDRFRQGDARFAREHGGLGLGLAIARDLVQLHGGSIQAASDGDGRGSTFRVLLPLIVGAAPDAPPPALPGVVSTSPT